MKIILSEALHNKFKNRLIFESIPMSSFELQDTLNPDIFDLETGLMRPEVRKVLLQVGKDFYEYLGVEWVEMKDIILTGSNANYNWSKYSDVDLHVVIPYSEISKNADLVDDYMWTKKELWNTEHDMKIKKYEMELYAQDTAAKLVSGGVYSVLYNKWLVKPSRKDINLDKDAIRALVEAIEKRIDELVKRFVAGDCYGLIGDVDDLKGDIRDLRQKGLSSGGEFSPENIAFKAIRRLGLLDKLDEIKDTLYDDSLSIEKSRKEKSDDGELKKEPAQKKVEKDKDKETGEGEGRYMIQGRRFISLRKAEKVLGIPKSTIEYRVKSDNPEYSDYKEVGT